MVRPNNGTTARILCPCGFRTADSDTICAARFQARRERKTARMERYKTKYLLLLSASILALVGIAPLLLGTVLAATRNQSGPSTPST